MLFTCYNDAIFSPQQWNFIAARIEWRERAFIHWYCYCFVCLIRNCMWKRALYTYLAYLHSLFFFGNIQWTKFFFQSEHVFSSAFIFFPPFWYGISFKCTNIYDNLNSIEAVFTCGILSFFALHSELELLRKVALKSLFLTNLLNCGRSSFLHIHYTCIV